MGLLGDKPLRLPRLRPYVPKPEDPPIFWFNSERDDIVREVVRRTVEARTASGPRLESTLNEVAWHEAERLEKQRNEESRKSLGFWRGLMRRVSRMSDDEKREALRSISERMAYDVAGNFDPRVYSMATKAVPRVLTGVMSPSQMGSALFESRPRVLDDLIVTEGCVDKLRSLAKKGTLVFVPTHSSNLDSIALGWALMRNELPPVSYGAGKNLFGNPIISFFMHNLGAYRVDRRVKAPLYKEVLKLYSSVLIERNYHSLFFPGGTRSRSNLIEQHLKLGLAGTGVEAFARNRARGIERPVYFVPTTINYALVLEAETLIEDHLKEAGKARFVIEDDEFSDVERWLGFFRRIGGTNCACVLRFAEPLDPFGNEIDDDGRSVAPGGRTIDPGTYTLTGGKHVLDPSRDAAYTKELGDAIAQRYLRDTVIVATQLVSHVLFRALVRATPGADLFGRMRHRGDVTIPWEELVQQVAEARDALLELEQQGKVRASPVMRNESAETIVERALALFRGYHRSDVAVRQGTDVVIEDPTLVLYYANRLVPYATRLVRNDAHLGAAREIAAMGTT